MSSTKLEIITTKVNYDEISLDRMKIICVCGYEQPFGKICRSCDKDMSKK